MLHKTMSDAKTSSVRLSVRVKPRSSRSKVLGISGGELVVALRAAPVDGAANAELEALLAQTFGLPRRQVQLMRGAASKNKMVDLMDVTERDIQMQLAQLEVLP